MIILPPVFILLLSCQLGGIGIMTHHMCQVVLVDLLRPPHLDKGYLRQQLDVVEVVHLVQPDAETKAQLQQTVAKTTFL